MSYVALAAIIYVAYGLLFLVGALLIALGLLARRDGRFGWGRIVTGVVLLLLPIVVIALSGLRR